MNKSLNKPFRKDKFFLAVILIFSLSFLTNCNKGSVEIFDIIDTVENCSSPYIVSFYPDAKYGSGDVEYTWTFGDGTDSHERNPIHVYSKTGIFSVTLDIKNKKAEDKIEISLDLSKESLGILNDWDYELLTAHAWAPARIEFKNYSERATSFLWDFDDGHTSIEDSPIFIFDTAGIYNVKLDAMCSGNTETFSKDITILPSPQIVKLLDIDIDMSSSFVGANIFCVVSIDGREQFESYIAENVDKFPILLQFRGNGLLDFGGFYNTQMLTFDIWDELDNSRPLYSFDMPMSQLQYDYYPDIITFEKPQASIAVRVRYE